LRDLRLVFFAGLLISMFVLTVKALQPVSIQLVVDGQSIELAQQPVFYSSVDVVMIGAAAFTAGFCLMYLSANRQEPRVIDRVESLDLSSVVGMVEDAEEKRLLGLVADAGGSMYQSDLVLRSGFSKGKVSLVLDRLEARGLIRRERSGMTNTVTIERATLK
jgi:uncharacterized membrane protein